MRFATALATVMAFAAPALAQEPVDQGAPNVPEFEPAFENQTRAPAMDSGLGYDVTEVAGGFANPWAVAVLPGGGYLVTERTGQLRHVAADGTVSDPIAGVPEVVAQSQGGLLDVKIGPDFAEDRRIYFTYAKPVEGGSATAAGRAVLSEDMTELTQVEDIFVQTPGSPNPMHFGSRIVFDGAGHAIITTGEHFSERERVFAQDLDKTYGKTIRVTLDGEAPEENPFVDRDGAIDTIWSYGHRNPQGAAFDPTTGALWTVEHGPAGGDELNLIEPGVNYGWPVISYGENYNGTPVEDGITDAPDMAQPVYYWDPVIAPSDMVFYQGDLYPAWQGDVLIGGLVTRGLIRLDLEGERVIGEERILEGIGRVRDIAIDADGSLLIAIDANPGGLLRITPQTSG